MYYVYLIELINGQYYTGSTSNLKQRIKYHFKNAVTTTRRIKPKELIYYCGFKTKNKALKFEKYLKSSSGFAFRNKHFI